MNYNIYTMDSVSESSEHSRRHEIDHSPEVEYLFDVVASRFNEASNKQYRNKDASYYTLENIGESMFYCIALTDSYTDLISKSKSVEVFDVLAPAVTSDSEHPVIDPIHNNPEASFYLRKYTGSKQPEFIAISRMAFEAKPKDTISAIKHFLHDKKTQGDEIYALASKIRDYELIPANVPPRYTPAEQILKFLGIDPDNSWHKIS